MIGGIKLSFYKEIIEMDVYNSESQNINIKNISCEIRKNIKESGLSKNALTFDDNFDEIFLSLIPTNNNGDDIEQVLEFLRNSWNIQPNKHLDGNRLIVFVKRVIRKLIKFIIVPIINEQNIFNRYVLNVLEKNYELIKEVDSLQDRIMQLEREIKRNG
jgi:hypothetical protein